MCFGEALSDRKPQPKAASEDFVWAATVSEYTQKPQRMAPDLSSDVPQSHETARVSESCIR